MNVLTLKRLMASGKPVQVQLNKHGLDCVKNGTSFGLCMYPSDLPPGDVWTVSEVCGSKPAIVKLAESEWPFTWPLDIFKLAKVSEDKNILTSELNKNKHMTKKDFILELGKTIFPNETIEYTGSHPYAELILPEQDLHIAVRAQKPDDSIVKLTPDSGYFTESDVKLVTKFIDKVAPTATVRIVYAECPSLVIVTEDYPWRLASYCETAKSIQELEDAEVNMCDTCEALRKANADKLRLQHELDEAKTEISRLKSQANKKDPKENGHVFEFPGGFGFGFFI